MSSNQTTKKLLRHKIKEHFLDWCENTTSHGISHSARSKSVLMRLLWIFFFFFASQPL
jgi:hypothetical protein